MDGKRLIRSIKLTNLLSFGPDGMEIELQPLNILIGANASGKSNFIEAFRVLNATPQELSKTFQGTSGVQHWFWKGENSSGIAELELTAVQEHDQKDIAYKLVFTEVNQRASVVDEVIELGYFFGKMPVYQYSVEKQNKTVLELNPYNSILSQRDVLGFRQEISSLAMRFRSIEIFTENVFGRSSPVRRPQDAALDSSFLFGDYSNLALVLNDLQNQPLIMRAIIEKLKLFYERVENIITRVQGGTVQIYFQEAGLTQTVPATRLSDGTLRYLCLLVLLLHPTPPPLMCIEEPELGMHPDILPTIAELLIDASQRTQLIVTTHSDLLISKIGEVAPEAVVVCERTDRGTTLQRLDPEKLAGWLEEYSLGEAWLKGAIGGTRW